VQVRIATWLVRLVVVILGVAAWHWSQSLIGARPSGEGTIGDGVHMATAEWNRYLLQHPACANGLLIASSAVIDALGIFLMGWSIVGPSFRPFIGLFILFVLRQLCQALCALPPPEGMIWHDPGLPSLLVTYDVSNDLFFSGHTGIAVLGAIELARLGRRWLAFLGLAIAVFEIVTVLVLRAHYTMDVFTGAVTAFFVAGVAARLAPACDRMMSTILWQDK
jgi:hypothetical protein